MFGPIAPTEFDLNFSMFKIPVRVHVTFWIAAAVLSWYPGVDAANVIISMLCILFSILVHELGHALMTQAFGWSPSIVLYYGGGYATTVRHSTWKSIAVSAAGPAAGFTLFGIAFVTSVVLRATNTEVHPLVEQALWVLIFINLIWNVFNLLPIYPMDGGQITREYLMWLIPRNGVKYSLIISMIAAAGIFALAITWNFTLMGIWVILFGVQNYQEYQYITGGGRRY